MYGKFLNSEEKFFILNDTTFAYYRISSLSDFNVIETENFEQKYCIKMGYLDEIK